MAYNWQLGGSSGISLPSTVQNIGTKTYYSKPADTASVAKRKWGSYDPNSYDYVWDGSYLNRTKKASAATVLETPEQKQAKMTLSDLMKNPTAFTGQLTAENAYSGELQNQLSNYLNQQNPQSLASAEKVLQDTLTGTGFDPNTSQYYQGVRQAANLNLQDSENRYARGQFLKGNLRSTATDFGRARLQAENAANLNQTLGQLGLQERQNQLSAVGQAQSLAGYLQNQQLNKLNAVQGTSSYLQQLEQAKLDAAYKEWLRQQEQKSQLAQFLYSQPVTYVY